MVNPAGTGRPMLVISARLAPLPPRRSFMSARPSALPLPKKETYLAMFDCSLMSFWHRFALGKCTDGREGRPTDQEGVDECGAGVSSRTSDFPSAAGRKQNRVP